MRIHAAQHTANGVQAAPAADFFYNYFHLGVVSWKKGVCGVVWSDVM